MKCDHEYYWNNLIAIEKFMYYTRAARFYYDGDGSGFVWRWWNPISWPLMVFMVIADCIIEGVPGFWRDKHYVGFGIHPWFKENPDRLEWWP